MKYIRVPDRLVCDEGFVRVIEKKTNAIHLFRPVKPRVKVEVLGGVAEVMRCSKGVTVTIQDHDNEATGH